MQEISGLILKLSNVILMGCSIPLSASKQHTGSRLTPPMKSLLKEQQAVQEWQRLAFDLGYEGDEELSFSQADELADTQIRFPAFLLTTHYWEGRWLMDMARIDDLQEEKKKKGD